MVKGDEEVVEGLRRPSNPARRERTIYGRRMKDAEGRNKEGEIGNMEYIGYYIGIE